MSKEIPWPKLTARTLEVVDRTLGFFSNTASYRGQRTGGVLQGCPRAPDPTPQELSVHACIARRLIWKDLEIERPEYMEEECRPYALLEQERDALMGEVDALRKEVERLKVVEREVNGAHTAQFLDAVKLEAAHQRQRWGTEHDAGKADEDWLFLAGFLGGKAVQAGKAADYVAQDRSFWLNKRLHHVITAAAVLLNWHAHLTGASTAMRPGIEEPVQT